MTYRRVLGIIIVVGLANLPAYADRGNGAYKHGVRAEREADFDAAYGFYKDAHALTPGNAKYFAAFTRMRFKAASEHLHRGQLLRSGGALKEALGEFQRAAEIDSSSFMAQQEIRLTSDMIRRQENKGTVQKIKADSQLAKLAKEVGESVELQPISSGPITFKMTANADTVYKTLCKLAGINVLIDPDYHAQKITIDLNNVTLLQALDMLRLQSKSYWRPVSANTIFVSADSPSKRKELEQNVMKTFYLQNISTPNDLQEAANVVSKILDVNRVQLLQGQDALVVRGTMDQMVLIEKLLANLDKPKSEVIIDVAVMQVSRDRVRTLGTVPPTSVSATYLPHNSGGTNGNGGNGGGYTIQAGNFAISVPGASFTALASDSNSKVLQNPQIRVLNDEKATLRIGDRVPIATGSFASGLIGGGSVSPLISTQFQYLDVGVNIDIVPHIHGDREVTLKMGLEISSVTGEQNIGGITQPIIGQRRIEHETRLADGYVNLIGGIIEDSESQSLSGYPWISKLPLLKYLFAQENKERREDEIIFAITPHIIRAQEVSEDDLRVVDVGTGSSIELHRKPTTMSVATAAHPAGAGNPQPSAAQVPPVGAPAPAPLAPSPTVGAPAATAPNPTVPAQAGPQNNPGGSQ